MQDERIRCGARVKYGIRLFLRESAFRFPSQYSDEDDDDHRDDNSINLQAQNNKSKFRFLKILELRRSVARAENEL